MRALGYVQDSPDGRDHLVRSLNLDAGYPASASNDALIVGVLDQGQLGSCVANAGFQAIRMSQVRQGLPHELGARLMGYFLARAYGGNETEDTGTQIRLFFQAANRHGFCRESEYSFHYDISKFASHPHPRDYRLAYDQRAPTKYVRIDTTGSARLDDVRSAIAAGYPVVFGTSVSNDFCSQTYNDALWFPPLTGPIAGGHAMTLFGYDGDVFHVVNSWGLGVGVQGRHRFSSDYIAWSGTHDLWIVEAAPPFSSSPS